MEDERLWERLRDLNNEVRELRQSNTQLSERVRVLEIARENSSLRQTQMPGLVIMSIGVLVSIISTLSSLWLAGRLP